jgi:hypothetical protein
MVLLDSALEKFLLTPEEIEKIRSDPYPTLNEYRNNLYLMNFESNKNFIEYASKKH